MNRLKKTYSSQHGFDKNILESFIKRIMREGKKQKAEKIVSEAFRISSEKLDLDVQKIAKDIVSKAKPLVEVKSRRVGGSTYPVPVEIRPKRSYSLAIRWIVEAARNKKSGTMIQNLANELVNIVNGDKSDAMTKRENVHKMAEANKAFEHFGSK